MEEFLTFLVSDSAAIIKCSTKYSGAHLGSYSVWGLGFEAGFGIKGLRLKVELSIENVVLGAGGFGFGF